jgi:hypothetical protein
MGLCSQLPEAAIVAKIRIVEQKNDEDLKAKRDVLFEQFLRNPKEIQLALEIKALDDKIAKLRFHSTNATTAASERTAR